ncbi:cation efflux system protein [Arenicella chitinivorans]|uniref:Cation efflux system protein n=1 Tax=Arenicella chitinivorans TaxID=1329800 RepID=A0A918RGG4_9GAMM|nr:cation diffusion facilitator family transporter [Arenicella chitinivorans]GGZ97911.1 cation efflux system protein [Arenicella chitinivorans]
MKVKTVLIIEALTDIVLMMIKLTVGMITNSSAIISDALHSLTDLANNGIALIAIRLSEQPSDADHHYGHRKFEHLAVFSLAVLLSVVALELVSNAIRNYGEHVAQSGIGMVVLLVALGCNVALTAWEHYWASRLDSDLLQADAKHTLSDVLTTVAVIGGWQFAALGYYWVDTLMAIVVAVVILVLAFRLLLRAVPILVDASQHPPAELAAEIEKVGQVERVRQVRARNTKDGNYADVIITVDPTMPTVNAHHVTEQIEALLKRQFDIHDVVVHVEPSE